MASYGLTARGAPKNPVTRRIGLCAPSPSRGHRAAPHSNRGPEFIDQSLLFAIRRCSRTIDRPRHADREPERSPTTAGRPSRSSRGPRRRSHHSLIARCWSSLRSAPPSSGSPGGTSGEPARSRAQSSQSTSVAEQSGDTPAAAYNSVARRADQVVHGDEAMIAEPERIQVSVYFVEGEARECRVPFTSTLVLCSTT